MTLDYLNELKVLAGEVKMNNIRTDKIENCTEELTNLLMKDS